MLEFEDLACIPVSVSKQPLVLFQYLSHFSSSRLSFLRCERSPPLTFFSIEQIFCVPACVIRKRKWEKIYKKKEKKKKYSKFPGSNHRAHESIPSPLKKVCSLHVFHEIIDQISQHFARTLRAPTPGHDSSNARNDRRNEIAAGRDK